MIKHLAVVATCFVGASFLPGVQAEAEEVQSWKIAEYGDWSVDYHLFPGKGPWCSAGTAMYRNSTAKAEGDTMAEFGFFMGQNDQFIVTVYADTGYSTTFEGRVELQIDSNEQWYMDEAIWDSESVSWDAFNTEFIEEIVDGEELYVYDPRMDDMVMWFSLRGSGRALKGLADCLDRL